MKIGLKHFIALTMILFSVSLFAESQQHLSPSEELTRLYADDLK